MTRDILNVIFTLFLTKVAGVFCSLLVYIPHVMKNLFSLIVTLLVLASCTPKENPTPWNDPLAHLFDPLKAPFYHGVASGDPLPDGVILWTRVTPQDSVATVEVVYEISPEQDFSKGVIKGKAMTTPAQDYTVKVDVRGLRPGTRYYYRFEALGASSATGQTRTAPTEADSLKFAVVSCSNYEFGHFNAYGAMAEREDLNAIVHLGDYIYEYGPGTYGDTTLGRTNLPAHEAVTLSDYRTRYAQYRLDPDLQAAHQKHPFINIWDDHEIANNAYTTGAQNHQADTEGEYSTRRSAAVQTYYEWLPIREGAHYRTFNYGNLADLMMLDERLAGRTAPADSVTDPSLQDESRSMLGTEQMEWLKMQLSSSQAKWKVVGNQVIFSYLNWGYEPGFTVNLDSWDGYPQEQKALETFIADAVENVIFVTGDTHRSWAFEVTTNPFSGYNPETAEGAIAVEFGTTSINSGNADERDGVTPEMVMEHEAKITSAALNPHLKFNNGRDHGFLLLTLTDEQARADFYYVPTLRTRTTETTVGKSFVVEAGSVKLIEVE